MPVIEIVSGLQWESVVYQVEIRNVGDQPIDMGKAHPQTAATGAPKEGLTLVRGSFELCPGARALIITHAAIDPNDDFRSEFTNVYGWIESGPDAVTLSGGAFTLIGDRGIVLGDSGPTMFTVIGKCCTNPGAACGCTPSCNQGCAGACQAKIGQARCCDALQWCCFKAGDTTPCQPVNGCPDGAMECP